MSAILNAFLLSLVAGLSTGLGGLLAIIRKPGRMMFGFLMGFASGVMVFLTLDELVPAARAQGHEHFTAIGIVLGAVFVFLLSGTLGV